MSSYHQEERLTGLEIAVIGMSCRFPGAKNIDEFWENLRNGIETITFFSRDETRGSSVDRELNENPGFVPARGIIDDAEFFDAAFFGYNPLEAKVMDPQIRIFHECCWEALEFAGYNPDSSDGLIGLYAGATNNRGWEVPALFSETIGRMMPFARDHLIDRDFLTTRIAYKLNLRGPVVTLKTACSTSLMAVDAACRGLLTGQCELALAGGVSLMSNSVPGYVYSEGMVNSPDGHCRAFDAGAGGVVFSEGAGAVLLKRLVDAAADGDTILAVIKGSAVNNDGSRKGTYESPCVEGQADVIRAAMHMAEVEPESITYIETHGTGTVIGDPIEIEGLKKAFNSAKKGFCPIGSVKTNFGHVDTAAGMPGFIKTVLALKHRLIPPSLHYENPNPKIDFENSPFYVNTGLSEWKNESYPLRGGVSSFGVGGTNVHVILEEGPEPGKNSPGRDWLMIPLSASTESALNKASENLLNCFKEDPGVNMADAAYTLQVGRKAFKHRKMWVIAPSSPDFSKGRVAVEREKNHPVFMFSGQGAQYVNMGLGLYRSEKVFREEMDRCFMLLGSIMQVEPKEILFNESSSEKINQTGVTQPLLFAFEYALAKLLMHWGIEPHAMIGHSIGEYVAACLSGVFSLEDALKVVVLRGKLMQRMSSGSMLSVTLAEDRLKPLMESHTGLSMAAVNAPSLCVVSGPHEDVDAFEHRLNADGIQCRRLHTSHAYHSVMMDPVLEEFENELGKITLSKPSIPYISNVSGNWITVEEAVSPAYWSAHIRKTVRFSDGFTQLTEDPASLFIEVGPGRGLATFVKHHAKQGIKQGTKQGTKQGDGHTFLNLVRHPQEEIDDHRYLLDRIGQLWLYGIDIDWTRYYSGETRRRIPLPTYPFERRLYRFEDGDPFKDRKEIEAKKTGLKKNPDVGQWFYTPSWKRTAAPPPTDPGEAPLNWLFFMDDGDIGSLLSERLEQDLRQTDRAGTVTVVRIGEDYESAGGFLYMIDPRQPDHYNQLIADLKKKEKVPHRIIHLWNVTPEGAETGMETDEYLGDNGNGFEDRGFFSLLYLAQAIGREGIGEKIQITVVTDNMQDVSGDEDLCPRKATVLGPAMVIPQEYPNIRCRSVDIVVPPAGSMKEKRLIDQLEAEVKAEPPDPPGVIAYRNFYRLVQTYEPLPMEAPAKEVPHLKQGGVYLITGGLGGIGLEIAAHLVRRVGAQLILTSRSPFPPGEEWPGWLETHGPGDNVSIKIHKIQELQSNGGRVTVVNADVSDFEAMRAALAGAEEQLGKINGVFHAAGVPGGGMIQLKTRETADMVLLPKVKGTLVLESLLKDRQLDFFILCSSINSVLPVLGQVDYFAANAFLDAFASYKVARGDTFTVSINWDTWQEVGMAVEAAEKWRSKDNAVVEDVEHPLFDKRIREADGRDVYITRFKLDRHWVLSEHKVAESGRGLVPGVTYLEMAREVFRKHTGADGTNGIEISDVYFLNPLMVGEGEERDARFILKKQTGSDFYDFLVRSRPVGIPGGNDDNEGDWDKHAVGKIRRVPTGETRHSIEEINAKCIPRDTATSNDQGPLGSALLKFGPRWKNIKHIQVGENEATAVIALDDAFVSDLDFYKLHTALLDSAAGFFFGIIGRDAYIPFSYKQLTMKQNLPSKIVSYSRVLEEQDSESGAGKESLKFDITVMDENGVELVDIKEFTMLRVSENIKGKIREKDVGLSVEKSDGEKSDGEKSNETKKRFLANGIMPKEGIDAFDRILAGTLPQVVVSTIDLSMRIENNKSDSPLRKGGGTEKTDPIDPEHLNPRPTISSVYVAPKTETERKIAEVWQGLLGIDQVGIHDDFFELGGDSLNIVQLNNELKKVLDKDIPVAVMFRYQTIHAFTQYLELEAIGENSPAEEEDRSEELKKSKDRLKTRMKRR